MEWTAELVVQVIWLYCCLLISTSARKLQVAPRKTTVFQMGAHEYKMAFTKKCVFRIMDLNVDHWAVFSYILYMWCPQGMWLSAKGSSSGAVCKIGLPPSPRGLSTLILQMQKSWQNFRAGKSRIILGIPKVSTLTRHFLEHFIFAVYLLLSTGLWYSTVVYPRLNFIWAWQCLPREMPLFGMEQYSHLQVCWRQIFVYKSSEAQHLSILLWAAAGGFLQDATAVTVWGQNSLCEN